MFGGPPTPGHLQPDNPNGNRVVQDSVEIYTTPAEDAAIQTYINNSQSNPGNWYMYGRNCTTFVENALAAGQRGTSTKYTPRGLMHDLHQEYNNQIPVYNPVTLY